MDLSNRHPGTVSIMRWFRYEHLADDETKAVAARFEDLAYSLVRDLPDGPELTAGLRKLLEAKDCFVRQAVIVAESP